MQTDIPPAAPNTRSFFSWTVFRIILGLGCPVLAVLGAIPILGRSRDAILGMPVLFAWLVLWMPVTSLLLWLCWHRHDRHRDDAYDLGGDVP